MSPRGSPPLRRLRRDGPRCVAGLRVRLLNSRTHIGFLGQGCFVSRFGTKLR